MSKRRQRILLIVLGFILVFGSLIWMKLSKEVINPIPAITFSVGLIAILGTVKRVLLDLSRQQNTNNK